MAAVLAVLAEARADVLVLAGVDADAEGRTLAALNAALPEPYPHLFTAMPNAGRASGLDLDGNGRLGEARDAEGYGRFSGEGGMGVLSRLPLGTVEDYSPLRWRDLPGALLTPEDPGAEVRRLSSMVHWVLPVALPGGRALRLGIFRATTPVFDGPEDLNGRRNHDELVFWLRLMEGDLPGRALPAPFVLIGGANLDPDRGEGRREAIRDLLGDPRLQDPGGGPTVDWSGTGPGAGLGPMRVDYILPGAGVPVTGAGRVWPEGGALAEVAATASRHRLIWVDLDP